MNQGTTQGQQNIQGSNPQEFVSLFQRIMNYVEQNNTTNAPVDGIRQAYNWCQSNQSTLAQILSSGTGLGQAASAGSTGGGTTQGGHQPTTGSRTNS